MAPGKPLTFTEWGGKAIGQGLPEMQDTVNMILKLEQEGKISGTSFWSWQDLRQYTRVDPEMHDGILESGVVTESRQPRPEVYMELKRLFEGRPQFGRLRPGRSIIPLRRIPWATRSAFLPVPLDEALAANARQRGKRLKRRWKSTGPRYALGISGRGRDRSSNYGAKDPEDEILLAGVQFHPALVDGHVRPLVTGSGFELEIPIRQRCIRLHVLGNISLPLGFPMAGKPGEVAAIYELRSTSGEVTEIPIRWGLEVVQGNMIHHGTRILPVAAESQPAIEYIKDVAREQYQILLYSMPVIKAEMISSLRCKVVDARSWLALFAITAELEQQS